MTLKYSCIHKICRDSPTTNVTHQVAAHNANNDSTHQALFDQLKRAFHVHARKQYGYFDPERADNPLTGWLSALTQNAITFEQFNQSIGKQIQQLFDSIEELFEHYLWIIYQPGAEFSHCYLFLLNHEPAHQVANDLAVEESFCVNPSSLRYAAKIDLMEWEQGQSKTYWSFLTPKTPAPIKLAFDGLIGYVEGINRAAQTDEFIQIVDQYADRLPPEDAKQYKNRVVDFCMDPQRQGDPVEIHTLSQFVDEQSPEAFMEFAQDRAEDVILFPDRNRLKRYARFFGRDQHVNISFAAEMFGNEVIYDESSDTLTIRAIPQSLRRQLRLHKLKSA